MPARDWKVAGSPHEKYNHSWGVSEKVVDIANGLLAWCYELYQDEITHTVNVNGEDFDWVEEPANVIEYRDFADLQAAANSKLVNDKAIVAAKEAEWLLIQDETERFQTSIAWKLANSETFANSLNTNAVITEDQWSTARNLPLIGDPPP